jgi:hypothetical protein
VGGEKARLEADTWDWLSFFQPPGDDGRLVPWGTRMRNHIRLNQHNPRSGGPLTYVGFLAQHLWHRRTEYTESYVEGSTFANFLLRVEIALMKMDSNHRYYLRQPHMKRFKKETEWCESMITLHRNLDLCLRMLRAARRSGQQLLQQGFSILAIVYDGPFFSLETHIDLSIIDWERFGGAPGLVAFGYAPPQIELNHAGFEPAGNRGDWS